MRTALASLFVVCLLAGCDKHGPGSPSPIHPVEVSLPDTHRHDVEGTPISLQLSQNSPGPMSGPVPVIRENQASIVIRNAGRERQVTLRAPPGDGVPDNAGALGWRVQLIETVPTTRVRVWEDHGEEPAEQARAEAVHTAAPAPH